MSCAATGGRSASRAVRLRASRLAASLPPLAGRAVRRWGRPCAHADCPLEGHPCARAVSIEAVIEEAMELLGSGQRRTSTLSALTANFSPTPGREELHSIDVRVPQGDRGPSQIIRMPLLQ